MAERIKYNDDLGQHMTPRRIAQLVSRELPGEFDVAVDFAVGHGDLLAPLRQRWPNCRLHGIDCDEARLRKAQTLLGTACVSLGDGVTTRLPASVLKRAGRFVAIVNPPFVPMEPGTHQRLIERAFPGVNSRHGLRRLEMAFLARALVEARRHQGWVAIILPSVFCSGLQYAAYRRELLERYDVKKAIEIRDGRFRDTEASTVLLIVDAGSQGTTATKIATYETESDHLRVLYNGPVPIDSRLDATYWSAAHLHGANSPTLGAVGAEVRRGVRSRAEAARSRHWVLHTTDLARHRGRRLFLKNMPANDRDVFAQSGDILLPRTGTRVRWEPVEVAAGSAPISDHLLCVRPPRGFRGAIRESFRHPNFETWLHSVSKGVCATVLTKRELLQMPLFALA